VALLGCWSSFERANDDTHEGDGVDFDGGGGGAGDAGAGAPAGSGGVAAAGSGGSAGVAGEPIIEDAGRSPAVDPSNGCNAESAFESLVARDSETCYELLAHNGGWEGDPLVLVQDEHLNQLYYDIPWPDGAVATRFGVQQDDRTSVHRGLVFEINAGSHGLVERDALGGPLTPDATLIAGWSVGGCNVELPSDVGLELAGPSTGKKLMVQWHHFNLTGETQHDASRFQICVAPRSSRTHIGSVTILGNESLNGLSAVPAGVETAYDSTCRNVTMDPVTIIALWPHMHERGTRVRVELVGAENAAVTVFDKPFRHDANVHYTMTPRVVVMPGETLRTSCTYVNDSPDATGWGISLIQELCYQVAFVYPAGALDNPWIPSLIGATNICWDQ
jgi:hypothetical protein